MIRCTANSSNEMCSIFEHIPDQKETEQIFQWIEKLENDRVLEVLRLQPDMINHRSRESGCPVSHYIAKHGNPALQEVMLFHPKTNMYLGLWNTARISASTSTAFRQV